MEQDIKEAAGPIQVCVGHQAGPEVAIHAMETIFQEDHTEGILLIDASNAFNSMNKAVALHNIQITCTRTYTVLINTYRSPSRLFIAGGGELMSREGPTQGDPLAMPFYAVFTSSLIISILSAKFNSVKQVWLADDASAAGSLQNLLEVFIFLQDEGKCYGYYISTKRSWLILKNESDFSSAKDLFRECETQVTTEGQRHLGTALGSVSFKESYVSEKVNQ